MESHGSRRCLSFVSQQRPSNVVSLVEFRNSRAARLVENLESQDSLDQMLTLFRDLTTGKLREKFVEEEVSFYVYVHGELKAAYDQLLTRPPSASQARVLLKNLEVLFDSRLPDEFIANVKKEGFSVTPPRAGEVRVPLGQKLSASLSELAYKLVYLKTYQVESQIQQTAHFLRFDFAWHYHRNSGRRLLVQSFFEFLRDLNSFLEIIQRDRDFRNGDLGLQRVWDLLNQVDFIIEYNFILKLAVRYSSPFSFRNSKEEAPESVEFSRLVLRYRSLRGQVLGVPGALLGVVGRSSDLIHPHEFPVVELGLSTFNKWLYQSYNPNIFLDIRRFLETYVERIQRTPNTILVGQRFQLLLGIKFLGEGALEALLDTKVTKAPLVFRPEPSTRENIAVSLELLEVIKEWAEQTPGESNGL